MLKIGKKGCGTSRTKVLVVKWHEKLLGVPKRVNLHKEE